MTWKGEPERHSMARKGVKTTACGVKQDFVHKQIQIDMQVNKHWKDMLNAEEDEILEIDGNHFEVIDKDSELLDNKQVLQRVYVLDDIARTWTIEYTSGQAKPVISHSKLLSKVVQSAATIREKKQQAQELYGESAVKVGRTLGRSAKKIGRVLGRTAKTTGRAAKRARKKVRRIA